MQEDDHNETSGEGDSGNGRDSPQSAAHYIAAITAELIRIARRNRLDTLAYLLEMAHLEADLLANE